MNVITDGKCREKRVLQMGVEWIERAGGWKCGDEGMRLRGEVVAICGVDLS